MPSSSSGPRKLRTYLGRVIRDIDRKTAGHEQLRQAFVRPLNLAGRVLSQDRRQRGRKVYSLHAPEVECIGKGKAHRPYEFGVKVSVATTVKHSAGGQFVAHAAALPGNPYDGHTLAEVIPAIEALIGNVLERIIADAGSGNFKYERLCPWPYGRDNIRSIDLNN
jgi:IS5 family transposase